MEEDDELAQIRARRMAELQAQAGSRGGPGGGMPGVGGAQQQRNQQEQQEKEEELRNTILTQILDQEARARLNILKAAKPDKAKLVENILIQNARMGALPGKLSEADLKDVLERVSSQTNKKTTVKFDRRRAGLDSDEDY